MIRSREYLLPSHLTFVFSHNKFDYSLYILELPKLSYYTTLVSGTLYSMFFSLKVKFKYTLFHLNPHLFSKGALLRRLFKIGFRSLYTKYIKLCPSL